MAGVFELYATLTLDTSEYKGKLKEAGNETDKTAKQLSAKEIAIGNVIADVARKGGEFFVQMAKTGIQYNAQIETYTMALTTALGSEAAAASAIERIKQDAARTPYSVDGLVKANSYLIAAGDSADEARDTIMALGNAISATGGGNSELQRMAQNLQQVKNVGKATSMDMRQFAMAGIDIYGILADYTGKSVAEVQKLDISYEMLSGALIKASSEGGKYFQAMERQASTMNGQFSTLKDNVSQKLGEAFEGLSKVISTKVLPAANQFVANLDLSKVSKGAETAAIAIAALVGPFKAVEGATKAAEKAQLLYNAAVANAPMLAVAGMLTVAAVASVDYARGIDEMVDAQRNFGESSAEVADRLAELRQQREALQEAADQGATEWSIYERMNVLDQEIKASEERYTELKAAEEGAADGAEVAAEAFEETAENAGDTVTALAELVNNYNNLHESITRKVKGWFSLFDEAKVNVKANVKDMMSAMQSQIDFNTSYSSNLDFLAANGLSNLGAAFQSMGAEGAAYAEAIVNAINEAGGATSEGGQKIINDFNSMSASVDASQSELSNSLTNITGTLESAFAQWGASAEQAAESLNVAGAAGTAGAASVDAYIAAISAGAGGAFSAAASVANSAASGFGAASGGGGRQYAPLFAEGADYIPYDNYLAYLHKGEMVIPASISNDLRDFVGTGGKKPSPVKELSLGSGNGEIIGLLKELIAATKRPIILDDGTLVGHTASKMDNALGDVGSLRERGLCLA